VQTVKIDRVFVTDLGADDSSSAVVSAIIAMAHALQKRVVAEGVETEEQRAILGGLGCDHIQGYLYGRPLPVGAFAAFVRHSAPQEATRRVASAKIAASA
jgi:EAL domain-containing protein (putative c-di-GMP-specific phosphodiesterase class I)